MRRQTNASRAVAGSILVLAFSFLGSSVPLGLPGSALADETPGRPPPADRWSDDSPGPNPFSADRAGPFSADQPSLGKESVSILLGFGTAAWAAKNWGRHDAMSQSLDGSPLEWLIDIGDAYGDGLTLGSIAAGLWLSGNLVDSPHLASAGGDLSRSLFVSWGAVWAIKISTNAERPDGGKYSFPSGHTATAFAAAPVITRHWGRTAGIAAYALAVTTAMGRMEDDRHYLADVIIGAAIGIVAGQEVVSGRIFGEHIVASPQSVGLRVTF